MECIAEVNICHDVVAKCSHIASVLLGKGTKKKHEFPPSYHFLRHRHARTLDKHVHPRFLLGNVEIGLMLSVFFKLAVFRKRTKS